LRFLLGFLIGLAAGYVVMAKLNVEREAGAPVAREQPVTAS
jgi:hypothetical protein